MLKAKLTIDKKHAQILKYLQQLIAKNYEPNTDDIETNETDTESGITDQQLEEEEENDIDEVIFIDHDTDNEEEQFMLIPFYLNILYVHFRQKNSVQKILNV